MAINLQHFVDGYKTYEVVFGDQKWVFREPSIKQILSLKDKNGAEELCKMILLEGSYDELDKILVQLTVEKKGEFYNTLLKELGLKQGVE